MDVMGYREHHGAIEVICEFLRITNIRCAVLM